MKLYTIRHGETNVNAKNIVNSRNIIGLNRNGKEQAEKASNIIKDLNIDLIICSPLRRAVQTCRIVNKNNLRVKFDRRLMERNARSMQFKSCKILDYDLWYDISKEVIYKNTEGFKSVMNRIGQVIEEMRLKFPNKNILFVTHGDVCKAIYAYLNNITDADQIRSYKVSNCHIAEYDI